MILSLESMPVPAAALLTSNSRSHLGRADRANIAQTEQKTRHSAAVLNRNTCYVSFAHYHYHYAFIRYILYTCIYSYSFSLVGVLGCWLVD